MPRGKVEVKKVENKKKHLESPVGIAIKKVVAVSDASDQTTTVAGIQAGKVPKFGKSEFHI